jgi:alpha-tubulin suppressor-like RCC1 family protein
MKRKSVFFVSLASWGTALLLTCQSLVNPDVGNTKITAMLYNPGGSPAANAKVCFYPHDYDPHSGQGSGAADSTSTDANGNYTIDLDSGTYNILANGDSGLAFQDSVKAARGAIVHPPACTLKTPGTIRGMVQLEPGDDSRTVFILFLGTHSYTTPDDASGNFISEPMAGGKYRVRILTTLPDYEVLDTSLTVIAGTQNVLPQPIKLKYSGISTPKNLVVSYDTLDETVVLSWDMPDTSLISGYNVYRSIKGQNFSLVTQTPLPKTQTAYHDTGLVIDTVYEYRVVSRTDDGNESRMINTDRDTALIVSSSMVTTTFSWSAKDTASINDTVQVMVSFSNPTRRINRLEWYIGTIQSPVQTKSYSSQSGRDTVVYYCPMQAGLTQFIVKAVDDAGAVWRDTFNLRVILDAPKANAGDDTCVSLNDTVYLHGSATQQFGSIAKWEWKLGSGSWTVTSGADTTVIMPDTETTVICSLAVTDEDGNRSVDDITIFIFLPIEKKVAAGASHSLVLEQDGTLWGCGRNWDGQLCIGDTAVTPIRIIFNNVQNISAGQYHSLILKTDGTLWACGQNYSATPVEIMTNVKDVAGGYYHTLILKTDGTLWSCGGNHYGQLGTGDSIDRATPVQVMTEVKSVTAGYYHSLIVKTEGTLWCCGENNYGQLGDGTTTRRLTPVVVMTDVQTTAAGYNHSLILKKDGTLWVCGRNYSGQLGDGTTLDKHLPVQIMTNVKKVSAGGGDAIHANSLILKADGTLWACGDNRYGQCGAGYAPSVNPPMQIMTDIQEIASGSDHSIILKTDGTVWACGWNAAGQLGDGTRTDRHSPVRIISP